MYDVVDLLRECTDGLASFKIYQTFTNLSNSYSHLSMYHNITGVEELVQCMKQ